MDGFTLTAFAFPVAPANLTGFTIQGFQWVGGPAPVGPQPTVIPGTWADYSITGSWADYSVTGSWSD